MAYKQNTRPPREPQGLVRVTGRPPLSVGSSSVRRVSQVRQVEVRTSQEETFVALPWCPRALYALEETHMEHGPCDVVAQALWRMHPRDGKNKKDKPLELSGLLRRLLGGRASLPSGAPAAASASVQRKGELARADKRKLYI